ncbi:LysR substrate-binding domain-containing protein [Alteromonas lipolytica]|uniref:LysR family transcriptional regulator n=1 Tax=Alteromonas lipolytica TaxID=1856405 RepID=A0A1E8F8F6_9ALTE|nr:LysR substrate-binding domain-containing protein [Alteromonas lipolytica]OFI32194.1 LysR family transcriptional regulator [Alteromonas lipolytica]GGF83113.1 LysR family transcriptional regulator [Alteromonas lipolytica]
MRDLPINLLRTFMVVADTLNLTEAAKVLHKATSTVSMQLNRLEELVANPLMERGQHGVRLTAAGVQLTTHARQLLNLHDQIVGSFQNMEIDGTVRLGSHDQYASRTLSPLLQEFILSYPEAQLEVFCDHSPDTLLHKLDKGQLDIALVEMMAGTSGGTRLRRDALVWVGSRDHHLQSLPILPLAVFDEGCYHRSHAKRVLEEAGIPYRIAFTSQSRAGVLAAVRAGVGIGTIPLHTLEDDLLVLNEELPALPETEVALFMGKKVNEATRRLEQIIQDSPLFNPLGVAHQES